MFLLEDTVKTLRTTKPRKLITSVLNMGLIVGSALFFWHLCMIASNCESPIVVVLSGKF
jgi:hypothetical protein